NTAIPRTGAVHGRNSRITSTDGRGYATAPFSLRVNFHMLGRIRKERSSSSPGGLARFSVGAALVAPASFPPWNREPPPSEMQSKGTLSGYPGRRKHSLDWWVAPSGTQLHTDPAKPPSGEPLRSSGVRSDS